MYKAALTKKQKAIFDYVVNFIDANGYSPSYREIGLGVGLSSVATVSQHIEALQNKGVLSHNYNSSRSILPIDDASEIPVLGQIAAGSPIEATMGHSMTIDVPKFMLTKAKNTYVLQVRGDSMIDDGILNGDYVVIQEKKNPSNGEVVVAVLGDGATLKRFYKEKGQIRLQPANSSMRPIILSAEDHIDIQGVVVGVIRRY